MGCQSLDAIEPCHTSDRDQRDRCPGQRPRSAVAEVQDDEALAQVRAYDQNRELLLQHSQMCWHFVHERFSWTRCATAFEQTVLRGVAARPG